MQARLEATTVLLPTVTQRVMEYFASVYAATSRFKSSTENYFTKEKDLLETLDLYCARFLGQRSPITNESAIEAIEYVMSHIEGIIYRLNQHFGKAIDLPKPELQVLVTNGTALLRELKPPVDRLAVTPSMVDQEKRQYDEQSTLIADPTAKLEALLEKIKTYTSKRHKAKRIFISYAWPVEDTHHELWAKVFVLNLANHLISAGFQVYMDQLQSGCGTPLYEFMTTNIERADHVIVICNRTMDFKFNKDGFTGACYEHILMLKRWKEERKERFIIPLCLTERMHIPGLIAQFAEVSIYKDGYLKGLMTLITKTYDLGSDFTQWLHEQRFVLLEPVAESDPTALPLLSLAANAAQTPPPPPPSASLALVPPPEPKVKQLTSQLMLKPPPAPAPQAEGNPHRQVHLDRFAEISAKIVNNTIDTLSLTEECFCCIFIREFAEFMVPNRSVRTINFVNPYQFGNDGAIHIAKMLRENQCLRSLTLRQKQIKYEGCVAIAEALRVNRSLETLDISWNIFGDDAVIALADALSHNTSFRELKLSNVGMTSRGALALKNMLENNHTIVALDVSDNRDLPTRSKDLVDKKIVAEINKLLSRNQQMRNTHSP